MEITFVNHASFILSHKGVSLITDPWLEGRVFNNGWDLVSRTRLKYDDFANIQYIWFSHEHPDHFSPPVIKKIPEQYRKNITVLFQHTPDGRVAEFCRKAGFKEVVELFPGKWQTIGEDFSLMCEHFEEGDSWVCFKCDGKTILNTNDCALKNRSETDHITALVGQPDILLTQFSYAYWAGNKDDKKRRERVAAEKLRLMTFQLEAFKPATVIPMASFVYFCHEENFYLNDSINTVERAYNFISKHSASNPVVLYNGDTWDGVSRHDSATSVDAYLQDLEQVMQNPSGLATNKPVDEPRLFVAAQQFKKNLKRVLPDYVRLFLKPAVVEVWDLDRKFLLSASGVLKQVDQLTIADAAMSSESLHFCLTYPYGLDTTQINGRLQKPEGGNYTRFYNLFRAGQQDSRGQQVDLKYVLGAVGRKMLRTAGLRK